MARRLLATEQTIRLTLAYDGAAYAGWQWQAGLRTLQGELEAAILRVTGEQLRVAASGRTDAGVHALGQVVSFRTRTPLEPDVLRQALNAELPRDMAVLNAQRAADGFHAQYHAVRKRYRYLISDAPTRDVFRRGRAWVLFSRLDADAMHRAGEWLVGTHDFCSFQSSGAARPDTVRTVHDLTVVRHPDEANLVQVEVEADGFLYNMVRTIAGTLVEVGKGRRPVSWPAEVLAARDRRQAGMTAPAEGLTLLWVKYDESQAVHLSNSDLEG